MLPIRYLKQGSQFVIHCVEGPRIKPDDSFVCQTERQQHNVGKHHLIPLNDIQCFPEPNIAGLIFHNARCGSTLLSNMLDQLSGIWVVRESRIINQLLQDEQLDDAEKSLVYLAILKLYSSYARSLKARCVLKFTSWCGFYASWLLLQHPCVPALFLVREPKGVVASLINSPPDWNAQRWLGEDVAGQTTTLAEQFDLFQNALLASIKTVMNHRAMVPMTYQCLVDADAARFEKIAWHFGVHATPGQVMAMQECLVYNAKSGKPYTVDSVSKGEAQRKALYQGEYEYFQSISQVEWND
jgi:hypothetical protein